MKKSKRQRKIKKDLIKIELIFLFITILFSLFGFMLISYNGDFNNTITGFASFSIYPVESETLLENITNETYLVPIIEESSKTKAQEEQLNETLTVQINDEFSIMNNAPTIGSVILNSTDPTKNNTIQNLTCYNYSVSDVDGDDIKTIFNWWYNTSSDGNMKPLMQLYVPFENHISNASKYALDYSGNENNGTVTNATWNKTGGVDGFGAYEFTRGAWNDPNQSYIDLGSDLSLNITGDITIAAWVKTDSLNTANIIVSRGPGTNTECQYLLGLWEGVPTFSISDGTTLQSANGTAIGTDNWTHIVGTYDGTILKVYQNSVKGTDSTCSGTQPTPANDTRIGAYANKALPTHGFNGTIDEVMIFNRSLSANQIQLLYENRTWIMHSDATSIRENWKCEVTPNDGAEDGAPVNSSALFVNNTAPTIGSVVLNSTDPTKNNTHQNLTCYNYSVSDGNEDDVKTIFNWWYNTSTSGELSPLMIVNMPFEVNGLGDNTIDYSGYGNIGTIFGATYNRKGGYDGWGAYEFTRGAWNDPNQDYINLGSDQSLNITGAITISVWVKPTSLDTANVIVSKGGGNSLNAQYLLGLWDGVPSFIISGGTAEGTAIGTDNWTHIVGTYDGTIISIYQNGVKGTDSSWQLAQPAPANDTRIGAYANKALPTHGFNGTIDEVMIFNRSLSANQIQLLYENRTWIIHSDVTSSGDYWKCEVIPNDGAEYGTSVNSSELEILSPPTVSLVNITSDDDTLNTTVVNLTGTFSATSSGGYSLTMNETRWYNRSIEVISLRNSTTVSYENTSKDDYWMFSARSYDLIGWSSWTNSSNFTILNTKPTQNNPVLNSTDPQTNDSNQNLICYNRSTYDIDSDSVINMYNWYLNDNPILKVNLAFEDSNNDLVTDHSIYNHNVTNHSIIKNKVVNFTYYPKFNISVNPNRYYSWPSMVRANNGDLLVAYYNGTLHASSTPTFIDLIKSSDNGTTWGDSATVASEADLGLLDPTLHVTTNGTILLAYDRVNHTGGTDVLFNASYKLSGDDGTTFGPGTEFEHLWGVVITQDRFRNIGDDIYVSHQERPTYLTIEVITFWKSVDNATTFTAIANITDKTLEEDANDEHAIINLDSTGTSWYAVFRSQTSSATYSKTSSDGGLTWSSLSDISSQLGIAQDPTLEWIIPYKVLLLTARDKTNTDSVAWVSFDNGTTWQNKTILDDYNLYADGGYTSSVIGGFPSPYTGLTIFYSDTINSGKPDIQGSYFTIKTELINRTGKIKKSSYFNNRRYLSIPNNVQTNLTKAFSTLFWIYLNPDDHNETVRYIISKSNTSMSEEGYYIAYDDFNYNNSIKFTVFGDDGINENTVALSNFTISSEGWYHIAATWDDSAGSKIYLNGVLNESNSSTLTLGTNNFDLLIANSTNGNVTFEKIRIDELKIYNISLSAEQINQIYTAENSGVASNVIVSQETSVGDSWKCAVIPYDGEDSGDILNSSELKINAIPVTGRVTGGISSARSGKLISKEPRADYTITQKEQIIYIKEWGTITFTLDEKIVHKMKILNVYENKIELLINSNNLILTLNLGGTIEIDLDNDNINDIQITLNSIDNENKIVQITIKKIPTVEQIEELREETTLIDFKQGSLIRTTIIFILVYVLGIFVVLYLIYSLFKYRLPDVLKLKKKVITKEKTILTKKLKQLSKKLIEYRLDISNKLERFSQKLRKEILDSGNKLRIFFFELVIKGKNSLIIQLKFLFEGIKLEKRDLIIKLKQFSQKLRKTELSLSNKLKIFLFKLVIKGKNGLINTLKFFLWRIKQERKNLIIKLKRFFRKLRKIKYKEEDKLKPKEIGVTPRLSNVLREFDNLTKKIKVRIKKKELRKANQDYNALILIYERIINELTRKKQIKLYSTLEDLYYNLALINLKRKFKPTKH